MKPCEVCRAFEGLLGGLRCIGCVRVFTLSILFTDIPPLEFITNFLRLIRAVVSLSKKYF